MLHLSWGSSAKNLGIKPPLPDAMKRRPVPVVSPDRARSRRVGEAPNDQSSPPARPRSQRRAAALAAAAAQEDSGDDAAAAQPESEPEDMDNTEEQETKKTRFVWTSDLHSRFETAVNRLGVATAKPQAIRKLMGCQTEEEPPTRQNIKSHLQKYRLLVQKQACASCARPKPAALMPDRPQSAGCTVHSRPFLIRHFHSRHRPLRPPAPVSSAGATFAPRAEPEHGGR